MGVGTVTTSDDRDTRWQEKVNSDGIRLWTYFYSIPLTCTVGRTPDPYSTLVDTSSHLYLI